MIPFWHLRLHTTSDYTWTGYFMYGPAAQDIRDALGRMPSFLSLQSTFQTTASVRRPAATPHQLCTEQRLAPSEFVRKRHIPNDTNNCNGPKTR